MDSKIESLSKQEIIALFYKEKETALRAASNYQNQLQTLEKDLLDTTALTKAYTREIEAKDKAIKVKEREAKNKKKLARKSTQTVARQQHDIAYYKDRIALLTRLLYGQKKEMFEGTPDGIQMTLPLEEDHEDVEIQ